MVARLSPTLMLLEVALIILATGSFLIAMYLVRLAGVALRMNSIRLPGVARDSETRRRKPVSPLVVLPR